MNRHLQTVIVAPMTTQGRLLLDLDDIEADRQPDVYYEVYGSEAPPSVFSG